MKLKRIMALVLAFCMVFSAMSFNVFAEETNVAVSSLTELQTALEADNDLPIEITAKIDIPANETVELNLNGKTINAAWDDEVEQKHIYVLENRGTLEISGGGVINTRGIFNYGKLTLSDGTINAIDCNGGYGVINYSGSTFTMNGGTLAATYEDGDPAVSGNYDATALRIDSGATATIEGGNISSVSNFTYAVNNAGTLNVSGGTIKGRGGISVVDGTVTITGGNILNDIDNDATGHAVYVEAGNVTIEGGNFTATNDVNDGNSVVYVAFGAAAVITGGTFVTNEYTKAPYGPEGTTITISGGNFDQAPADAYIADGYEFDADGNVVESAPAETVVATVDGVEFTDLQAALDAAAAGTGNVTVEILEDIDLTGVDWNPVTVSAPGYPVVTVNGNNKKITGLNDMLFAGTWAGHSGLIINDLTIADSTIVNDEGDTKGNVGVGAFIGFPQASATVTLNNCHLVDSSVEGGHWTGGLIGYAAGYAGEDGPVFMNLTINECSVTGSTITGKGSAGGIIGHATGNAWTQVTITDTTVSGNTVASTGSSTNKAGAVIGTIGAAGQATTVNGVEKTGGVSVAATVSGNNVTSSSATITTIYGRQGTSTGMLYVTGGEYDNYPIENDVVYAVPADGYKIVQNSDGTFGVAEKTNAVAKIGDTEYSSLAEVMKAAKSGETVELISDVDLAGTEWEPVSFKGKFNGNGYTIKNLTINKPGVSNVGFITSLNSTFENVTFENPTVTGGENTAVLAGRAGGSASLAKDIKVTGTIKVETTHSGYARAGVIVGGWAYGNYENITVDGINKTQSYIKHTGGGDGRYVAGIVGHADDVNSYVNCTVKNFTISGGWLCGAIAGPGPSDGLATGCTVENVDINADYSGGMFGWYYGDGTIENSTIKNVAFTGGSTKNGAIGGYSDNESATVTNVTIENVKNADGKPLLSDVATVTSAEGDVVIYATLADAVANAESGAIITILKNGEYGLPYFTNKELTFRGESKDGIIINDAPDARDQGWSGSSIHFETLTAKGATGNYHGLANGVVTVTYKDCNVNNLRFLYATDTVSFDDCTFNSGAQEHSFWTYGAKDITVTNCTFNYADRAVNCYSENGAAHETDISFSGCTFNYTGSKDAPEGAVEINSGTVKSIDVDFTSCNAPAKGAMWFNSQWDTNGGVNTTVDVEGIQVWPMVEPEITRFYLQRYENGTAAIYVDLSNVDPSDGIKAEVYSDISKSDKFSEVEEYADDFGITVNQLICTTEFNQEKRNDLKAGTLDTLSVYIPIGSTDLYWNTDWQDNGKYLTEAYMPTNVVVTIGDKQYTHDEFTVLDIPYYSEYGPVTHKHWDAVAGVEDVSLPTATVTQLENEDLTFALSFSADEASSDQLRKYWDWYADFELVVNDDVTFNANNDADGYLSGQYDAFGEGWLNVPFEDVKVTSDNPFRVMDYADGLFPNNGLKFRYFQIYGFVQTFNCGVFLDEDFKAANPDFKMELALKMYDNGDKDGDVEGYPIGPVHEFNVKDIVAKIGDVTYSTLQEAVEAAQDGDVITVLADHELTWDGTTKIDGSLAAYVCVAGKAVTIDLNGKKLTGDTAKMNNTKLYAAFATDEGGSLTFKDSVGTGSVSVIGDTAAYCLLMGYEGGTKLNVEGGTYYLENASDSLVYSGGASDIVTVTGGNFTLGNVGTGQNGSPWIFNVYGSNENHVTVTGGTYNANIFNQHWRHEVQCDGKYVAKDNGNDTWTVVPAAACVIVPVSGYNYYVGYETVELAFEAAQNGETIKLLKDVSLDKALTNNKNVTLDLNGNTITGKPQEAKAYAVVENLGELTITGGGSIVCDHQLTGSTSYAVNTIHNRGALVIEDATIENNSTSANQIGYAIDNNSTTSNATVIVNGGVVKVSGSNYYDGIRQFCNSQTAENSVTVTGGEVSSIWLQNPSDGSDRNTKDVKGSINIAGGKVNALHLEPSASFEASITDGVLGKVAAFETAEGRDLAGFIAGGIFDEKPNAEYAADGYEFVENEDGTYTVAQKKVASVKRADGNTVTEYTTLAEAVAAATDGDEIVLLGNIAENVTINNNITLDGADKDYTGTMTVSTSKTVTVQNVNFVKGSITESKGNRGTLTVKGCDFDGVDKSIGYAITVRGGDKLVIENCTAKNYSYGMLYIPSAVANVSVKDVNVSDVTAAFNISYSGDGIFENVKVSNATYGLHIQNHGARTFTLTGCEFDCEHPIYVQVKGTANVTFNFEGANAMTSLHTSDYAKYILSEDSALTAPEGYNVTTNLEGYKVVYENGVYKVAELVYVATVTNAQGVATNYTTLAEAVSAANAGDTVTLLADVTVEANETITLNGINFISPEGVTLTNSGTIEIKGETTLNIDKLSGNSIDLLEGAIVKDSTVGGPAYVGGNVTFRGDNTFTMITDFGDFYSKETPSMWTIETDASVTLTSLDRYGLGYGDNVTVYGTLAEGAAKNIDRTTLTTDDASVNMYGGLVGMTNSAAPNAQNSFAAKNAYLRFGFEGDKSFGNKSGTKYYGNYTFTFENVVMDANGYKFYEDSGTSNVVFKDSNLLVGGVLMTNDASSTFTYENTTILSQATSNGTDDKNQNAGAMKLVNSDVTYSALVTNIGTIEMDADSTFTAPALNSTGTFTIDATDFSGEGETKLVNLSGTTSMEGIITVENVPSGYEVVYGDDGDVTLVNKKFDIGTNMTLGGELGVNFYVPVANCTDGIYAEIVKTYADSREDVTVEIPYEQWTSFNTTLKRFSFSGVAAKEMSDSFEITIYDAEGNAISNTLTTSIRDYAMDVLSRETTGMKSRILMVDMLNYGASAQIKFKYGTSDLANAWLTDEQKELATDSVSYSDVNIEHQVPSSLLLEDKIALNLYFADVTDTMRAVVEFTDSYGNKKTVNIPSSEFGTNGSYKFVTVDELAVADYQSVITCTIYDGENVHAIGQQSIEQYLKLAQSSDPLYNNIMKFATSAYAFMHQ